MRTGRLARNAVRPLTHAGCGVVPSRWLADNLCLLPKGAALDVACGTGRNTLMLASLGWQVTAVDHDAAALEVLARRAARHGLGVVALRLDLEGPAPSHDGPPSMASDPFPEGPFDLVVVFNYLHRPLFPKLRRAVRPGGTIVYETFTEDQRRFGRPANPDFLLRRGELRDSFADWVILAQRERIVREGPGPQAAVASLIARRPVARRPCE